MKSVIVLIAHGTVSDLDDLQAFVTEIRRGRPAPPELVAELRQRYERVGGSPLLEQTHQLARAVAERSGLETRVAMRLWEPRLGDVVADLAADDRVCLVPLAPYSVAIYEAAARRELARRPSAPKLDCVPAWGDAQELIEAWVARIRELDPPAGRERRTIVLSAHSLPRSVIDAGDPYALQFEAAARRVEAALGRPCQVAYQSQGAVAGEWLGPTLLQHLEQARAAGAEEVLVAPIGFLAEHIETLFDLDIEARDQAEALGLRFARVPTLRDDPALVGLIDRLVRNQLGPTLSAAPT